MRRTLIALTLLAAAAAPASAQFSVGIGFNAPGVSIGINLPIYPDLVRVPGYPVYYAPTLQTNFFFYDGLYWVYQDDGWYSSDWYNGPWASVSRDVVPVYVLRIPVRYYRNPPSYFQGWRGDAPPRWNEHWGAGWQQRRSGWNQWDHRTAPAPAALPTYQRKYPNSRYPEASQQRQIREEHAPAARREAAPRQPLLAVRPPPPRPPVAAPRPQVRNDGRDKNDGRGSDRGNDRANGPDRGNGSDRGKGNGRDKNGKN